jgi:hypothetical protein
VKPRKKYEETFDAEFKRVSQNIRNCRNFEEIKNYINGYMTQVDYVDYKLDLNGNEITESDLKILRENIEKELTTKGSPRNEPFQNPSDDKKDRVYRIMLLVRSFMLGKSRSSYR